MFPPRKAATSCACPGGVVECVRDPAEREPCPVCGTVKRKFQIDLTGGVVVGGISSGKQVFRARDPERADASPDDETSDDESS
jgi:hypothetical protein